VEASGDGRRLLAEGSSEVRRPAAPGQHEGGGALGGSCVAAIGSVGWDSDGEEEDGRVFSQNCSAKVGGSRCKKTASPLDLK
jgi:hypothetical protein